MTHNVKGGWFEKSGEEKKETSGTRDIGNSFESLAPVQHVPNSSILEGLKG